MQIKFSDSSLLFMILLTSIFNQKMVKFIKVVTPANKAFFININQIVLLESNGAVTNIHLSIQDGDGRPWIVTANERTRDLMDRIFDDAINNASE